MGLECKLQNEDNTSLENYMLSEDYENSDFPIEAFDQEAKGVSYQELCERKNNVSSTTLCLKQILKSKVLDRRKSKGLEDIETDFTPPQNYPMTAEEILKEKRRKESNRQSAHKSREKEKQEREKIEKELQELEAKREVLAAKVKKLEIEKTMILEQIQKHVTEGHPNYLQEAVNLLTPANNYIVEDSELVIKHTPISANTSAFSHQINLVEHSLNSVDLFEAESLISSDCSFELDEKQLDAEFIKSGNRVDLDNDYTYLFSHEWNQDNLYTDSQPVDALTFFNGCYSTVLSS